MFPNIPRPGRLSNHNCCHSDAQISAIDAKPIHELGWSDFEAIFTLSGCTAAVSEQLFYLPLALDYLCHHPDPGTEFVPGLVHFIASQREALDRAGFLAPAFDALHACFSAWTNTFRVEHYDSAACAAKGWRLDHDDIVESSWSVRALIDALLRYGLSSIAEEMVESWVSAATPESSAWLLEFAKQEREAYAFYSRDGVAPPHLDMTPSKGSKRIFTLVMDSSHLRAAYARIKSTLVADESSPTYWRDLVAALALTV